MKFCDSGESLRQWAKPQAIGETLALAERAAAMYDRQTCYLCGPLDGLGGTLRIHAVSLRSSPERES